MVEIAWCDNNIVLFATIVGDPIVVIICPCKKPLASYTRALKTCKVFGDEVIKDIPIPMLINQYTSYGCS